MLSHRNALAFVDWAVDEFACRPRRPAVEPRAAPLRPLGLRPLRRGARRARPSCSSRRELALFPVELARFIGDARDHGLVLGAVDPDAARRCAAGSTAATCRALRAILFAGEVFPTKYLARLMQLLPHVRFVNLYGPTETNVCTWYEVPRCRTQTPDADPDRRGRSRTSRSSPSTDDGRSRRRRRGRRAVRARPDRDAGLLGRRRAHRQDARRAIRWRADAGDPVYRTGDLVRRDERRQTAASSAGATRRSRAAATGSSSARSRRRCYAAPARRRVRGRRGPRRAGDEPDQGGRRRPRATSAKRSCRSSASDSRATWRRRCSSSATSCRGPRRGRSTGGPSQPSPRT